MELLAFFDFNHFEEMTRIGIVGFGSLGKYLYDAIEKNEQMSVVWVWNRSGEVLDTLPEEQRLFSLADFVNKPSVDLIVEVAHPSITEQYGELFLQHADYFVGSPTCFASQSVEDKIRTCLSSPNNTHTVYVPSGALWGAQDIFKMASSGSLHELRICMKKHPSSLKLNGELAEKLERVKQENLKGEVILYEGPVRDLCPLAPNNVNTMAAGALAGFNLGFDRVMASLICDESLDAHVITIEASGAPNSVGDRFRISTERYNPAAVGAVTGSATYASFYSSLLKAHSCSPAINLC